MDRRDDPGPSRDELFHFVRSLRDRPARDSHGRYWLEGVKQFVRACDAGVRLDTVVYCPKLLKSRAAEVLVRKSGRGGARRVRVTPEEFRRIATLGRACGVGAVAVPHWSPLEAVPADGGLGWLVIEDVRSPGNLGTILRTAEAVGVTGVLFAGPGGDPFAPAVVRASMGGLFGLTLCRASHARVAAWVRDAGVRAVGLSPEGETDWDALPRDRPVAVVLGGERAGLSEASRSLCETAVRLPMVGGADSLNVSVAAGVMLYELVRRDPRRGDAADLRDARPDPPPRSAPPPEPL